MCRETDTHKLNEQTQLLNKVSLLCTGGGERVLCANPRLLNPATFCRRRHEYPRPQDSRTDFRVGEGEAGGKV